MEVKLPIDQNVGGRPILVYAYWMLVGAALTLLILDFAGLIKKGPCDCDDGNTPNPIDGTDELRAKSQEANGQRWMASSNHGNSGYSETVQRGFEPTSATDSASGD